MSVILSLLALLAPQDDASDALARVLARLRREVSKCVVAIEVERSADPEGYGGAGPVEAHRDYYNRPKGPCSGVIYESEGFILTSWFNVSGTIKKGGLKVTLHDGRECAAQLLGSDQVRDIALLKVEEKGLPTLPKADLTKIGPGVFVAMVGRSPDKQAATLNFGILSAMHRMKGVAVQTDAEMNYGNTGGALVTMRGELIGVGCNIRPRTHWGQSGGIGFACKATEIDAVLDRLKKGEVIVPEKRPFLGIRPGEGVADVEGVQVSEVIPGSPAEKAGLKAGDVIVEFAGKKITDFESLREAILAKKIGEESVILAKRKNEKGEYEQKSFKAKLEGAAEEE